ncbi:hypothetical protein GUJ93_ZPchr0004g38341 [Zizania palustris]|uniref:non-specific serine/threonine protein kinase n=1 Tax=Zizania palustris TaxID=103762 RepID=A0A8J5S6T9_ZIZPA|nr:hypothetical protein GUJ93_ZPchr0004g38341 [Zizania palustris]
MGNCFASEEAEGAVVKAPTPGPAGHHHGRPQEAATARRSPMATPSALSSMSAGHAGRSSSSTSSITTRSSSTNSSNVPSVSTGPDVAGASYPEPLEGTILEDPNLRIFTFAELRAATRNFKPDTVLGEGGFGRVYKGWVDEKTMNPARSGSGMVIAVKKLNPESVQGLQEWQSEVNFLGRLSHPNLVRLLGYCVEDRELLLVYEFMAKGSLENHLFRKGSSYQPISWGLRLRIAIGAARGLAFLHSSEKQIIYRDFKASNILLDTVRTHIVGCTRLIIDQYRSDVRSPPANIYLQHYNAKLSDFGLAKNGPTGGDSHVTTRVMGTYGYAPEYVATGHLYVKSDVYGFGVVLLEMLTGMRALDTRRPAPQHNLVDWAKPYLDDKRRLARLVDPRLEGQYPSRATLLTAQLTLRCLSGDPKSRPSMSEVVNALEEIERINARPNALPAAASREDALPRVSARGGGYPSGHGTSITTTTTRRCPGLDRTAPGAATHLL